MAISLSNNHNHPKKIGIIMDGNGRWAKLKIKKNPNNLFLKLFAIHSYKASMQTKQIRIVNNHADCK